MTIQRYQSLKIRVPECLPVSISYLDPQFIGTYGPGDFIGPCFACSSFEWKNTCNQQFVLVPYPYLNNRMDMRCSYQFIVCPCYIDIEWTKGKETNLWWKETKIPQKTDQSLQPVHTLWKTPILAQSSHHVQTRLPSDGGWSSFTFEGSKSASCKYLGIRQLLARQRNLLHVIVPKEGDMNTAPPTSWTCCTYLFLLVPPGRFDAALVYTTYLDWP